MNDEIKKYLPEYFSEFLEDRPSSKLKLLAAWDGLSTETQIQILHYYTNAQKSFIPELRNKILTTKNDYVRYLIGSHFNFSEKNDGDKQIISELNHSNNYLTKFIAKKCNLSDVAKDPATFFSMSHNERLTFIDKSRCRYGEAHEFTALLEFALRHNAASEQELKDLVSEYLQKLKKDYIRVEENRCCGWLPYKNLNDIKAFVNVVAKLPKQEKPSWGLGNVILYLLPIEESEFHSEEYGELEPLLLSIDECYLIELLHRSQDIRLKKLREKIFFDISKDKELRLSAASRPIEITNKNLQRINSSNDEIYKKLREAIADKQHKEWIGFVWKDKPWLDSDAGYFRIVTYKDLDESGLPIPRDILEKQWEKDDKEEEFIKKIRKNLDLDNLYKQIDEMYNFMRVIKWVFLLFVISCLISKIIHWLS